MTRKRKKRAAARAKRRRERVELEQPIEPPPPAEAWSEVVDGFREMLQLESKTGPSQALRLMHALEVRPSRSSRLPVGWRIPPSRRRDLLPGQTAWISVSWLAAHTRRVA